MGHFNLKYYNTFEPQYGDETKVGQMLLSAQQEGFTNEGLSASHCERTKNGEGPFPWQNTSCIDLLHDGTRLQRGYICEQP